MNVWIKHSPILLFIVVFGCNDDNPIGPPDAPSIIPFAEGATWEYNYNYAFSDYPSGISGKFTVVVQDQYNYPDSIVYVLNTATAPDNGDSTISEKWRILLKSDTLWMRTNQDWQFMTPSKAPDSGKFALDIKVFVPIVYEAIYERFPGYQNFRELTSVSGLKEENVLSFSFSWNPLITGAINESGITEIHYWWRRPATDLSPATAQFDITLESFTPSAP